MGETKTVLETHDRPNPDELSSSLFFLVETAYSAEINQQNMSHYSCHLEDSIFSGSPGIALCLLFPLGDSIL